MTDANLVLGYLTPEGFASGSFDLDPDAAREALDEAIAKPLGTSVERAAWAIHIAANANMASAIHVVTVQRGLDPRDHTLVAFGGAGPMHVVGVANHFGIDHVIAPPQAGVASAIGMQSTDLTAEHGRTHLVAAEALDSDEASSLFSEVEQAARRKMGIEDDVEGLIVERLLDVRFVGQAHEVSIPVEDLTLLSTVPDRFRERYRELYGVAPKGRIEFAAIRVRLRLPVVRPPIVDDRDLASKTPGGHTRPAFFDSGKAVGTKVIRRGELGNGAEVAGPVIVEGPVDTTVVPPGWSMRVDEMGSLHLRRTN